MKNLECLLAFISMALWSSCTDSHHQGQMREHLEYDSISVPIDYPFLGFYHASSLYAKGDVVFWAGYNHLAHSVDVVDITNRRTVESLALEAEGPNAIPKNKVGSFVFNDSLIVFSGYSNDLKLYSRKDKAVRATIRLFDSNEDFMTHYVGILAGQFNNFGMRLSGDRVVLPVFSKGESRMDDVIATSVNLRNATVKPLDIAYPKEMEQDLQKYGSLTYPCLTIADNQMVYNFPYSSRVYSYSLDSGGVETLTINSVATNNQADSKPDIEKRDFRRHFDYENKSLRFCETYYDKKSDSYIRVHHDKKENTFDKEVSYLMIHCGKSGQTVEYCLPSGFSTRYYVNDGFVYFLLNNDNDVSLNFAAVDIEKCF